MTTYTLTPRERPPWRFTADDLAARIKNRWPHARVGCGDLPGSPMLLHALVPFGPPRRELGIAVDAEGWAVVVDAADPATATEFALWYAAQLPGFDPPVHLITEDGEVSLELRADSTPDDLLIFLSPHLARPDPRAVGRRAAEVFDRVFTSPLWERLAGAVAAHPDRGATFTGFPLIARLDLAHDAGPLLVEAMHALALRAAVYQLTGSDETAATLVVPLPVDNMIRLILAQHTLCLQTAHQLGVRFVAQPTDWDYFGWRRGDYTHQCFLAADWGEPDERYWLDADETARRLKTLNSRYVDIGIRRGIQHNLRFEPLPDPSMVAI